MKKSLLFFITALTACATTYQPPLESEKVVSSEYTMEMPNLMKRAKQILLIEGYQIKSFDDDSGIISTDHKTAKLFVDQADCGSTMGLDYLKDNRTKTEIAINVVIADGLITVKSNIKANYEVGSATQDLNLSCISKGVIEDKILKKILNA